MAALLLKAAPVTAKLYLDLKQKILNFQSAYGRTPKLATVLIGDDPASRIYVSKKGATCRDLGMGHQDFKLPSTATESELLKLLDTLNADDETDGILVQSPLPKQISEQRIYDHIHSDKDVDCFSSKNVGLVVQNRAKLLPCTPAGVMGLLKHYHIELAGKNALVVGRSDIVGKPMALLLLHANATVTVAHSKTADLAEHVRKADIIVSAIGRRGILNGTLPWKSTSTVIDVGIHRNSDGRVVGDCDFATIEPKVTAITPVPGGVGPMTIAWLMANTVEAAQIRKKK